MRRLILFFCLIFIKSFHAQDTLFMKNSEKRAVLLLEVNPDNVKYKRFDLKEGPTYTVNKNELLYVRYSNGIKEYFEKPKAVDPPAAPQSQDSVAKNTEKNPESDFFAGDRPDTIFFNSGKVSVVKVLIAGSSEIKYKIFTYQDGPTYVASTAEVRQIVYGRGVTQTFGSENKTTAEPNANNGNNATTPNNNSHYEYKNESGIAGLGGGNMFQKGYNDGLKYYKHNGGSIGVGCAAAGCGPVIGAIPAGIVSYNEPQYNNLGLAALNTPYKNNSEYVNGYTSAAAKIKRRKVWTAYGIGSAACLVFWVALAILVQ